MNDSITELREWSHRISTSPAPTSQVLAAGRRARRLSWTLAAAAGVVTAALLVGGLHLLRPAATELVPARNALEATWWADGTLHMAGGELPLRSLDVLATVANGVVVGIPPETGVAPTKVVFIDKSGHQDVLGRKALGAPLASDPDGNRVAWVDPRDKEPQLLLYDTEKRRVIASLDLPYRGPRWEELDAGSVPIALDDGSVYYATQDGDYRWSGDPGERPERVENGLHRDLTDVKRGVHVVQMGREATEVARSFAEPLRVPGDNGQLTQTGRWLTIMLPDLGWAVRDVVNGSVVSLQLPRGRHVEWLEPLGEDAVLALLATELKNPGMQGPSLPYGPPYDAARCELPAGTCAIVVHDIQGELRVAR